LDFANIAAVMSAGFGALTKLIQLFSMSQTTSVTNFMLALLDKSAQPILFDEVESTAQATCTLSEEDSLSIGQMSGIALVYEQKYKLHIIH